MAITYSTYEAKARFSEVLRQVRAGDDRYGHVPWRARRGDTHPIRPRPKTTEERLDELERRGELVPPTGPPKPLRER